MLAAQLDHIRSTSTLSNVVLGVIPADAEMRAVPWCGSTLYEDRTDGQPPFVAIETTHAGLTVNNSEDIAIYREQLELFRASAIFDDGARDILTRIAHEQRHASQ